MNSFNVYGQTETKVGGNTPVWLGTVKPIPRGGVAVAYGEDHYCAGTPVLYKANTGEVDFLDINAIGTANGYLLNDVFVDSKISRTEVTCAVVMHHPEGLLIERVIPEITEEQIAQLQARIPGVLLVRG